MNPTRNCGYCDRCNVITRHNDGDEKCIFCQVSDGEIIVNGEPFTFTENTGTQLNPLHPDVDVQLPE